jgi:hypothetical protein
MRVCGLPADHAAAAQTPPDRSQQPQQREGAQQCRAPAAGGASATQPLTHCHRHLLELRQLLAHVPAALPLGCQLLPGRHQLLRGSRQLLHSRRQILPQRPQLLPELRQLQLLLLPLRSQLLAA